MRWRGSGGWLSWMWVVVGCAPFPLNLAFSLREKELGDARRVIAPPRFVEVGR